MAIFGKMGVVWPLIIDQRLVHLTPHMCSEVATQPPFFMKIAMSDLENSHERPFSIILEANTYGILTKKCLHQKSKNVFYGKETYVG